MENQFQFKPFDQVLVRDYDNDHWCAMHYSHFDEEQLYFCGCSYWRQCIPYNEETAHLLNTNKPYKKPEPIKWYIDTRDGLEKYDFTDEEFTQFLNEAVMKNKDITDFRVRYVPK